MTKKTTNVVTGYKGFDEDWQCQGKKYTVGKATAHRGNIKLCHSGLHFCENPLDVLSYYPLVGSKFAEVEASGVADEKGDDSKRVARKLHIKAELTLPTLVKAAFDFIYKSADVSEEGNATSGSYAHSATSGNRAHSATSGNRAHSATSGDDANSATSGDDAHSATSGRYANSATSGDDAHSATSGSYAHSATSGNRANSATSGSYAHSATSGNRANSATSGYGAHSATSGVDNAIACSIGRKAKAKASKGCWIVLAEWYEDGSWEDARPINIKSAQVDGKKVKADQWYKLVNGEFVETDDSNE